VGGTPPAGALAAATPAPAEAPARPPATLAQLAGQRMVVGFPGTTVPASLARSIRRGETGAVILMGGNVRSRSQVVRLTADLQSIPRPAAVDAPLLIVTDQEGGQVRRIPGPPGRSAVQMGRGSVASTRATGRATGRLLAGLGIGAALSPVADVARPGSVLERFGRTFGRTRGRVAAHSVAFARGLREGGALATAKHFPGLGVARVNTDDAPVAVRRSRRELERVDLAPFRALIRARVPMVMSASASYPALGSPGPALLTRRVVTGLLRNRLGFDGVVITDALDTPALGAVGPDRAVAVRAARAGNDLLIYIDPARGAAAARGLRAALGSGRLDRDEAERSLERVLALRETLAAGG
ncbi:MAG: glycoside hydrolase family 3 N-terminal domain-containing protein, partial [Miltoncostaeaceae bacterium]